LPARVLYGSG